MNCASSLEKHVTHYFFLIGALIVSFLASPIVVVINLLRLSKIYALVAGSIFGWFAVLHFMLTGILSRFWQ